MPATETEQETKPRTSTLVEPLAGMFADSNMPPPDDAGDGDVIVLGEDAPKPKSEAKADPNDWSKDNPFFAEASDTQVSPINDEVLDLAMRMGVPRERAEAFGSDRALTMHLEMMIEERRGRRAPENGKQRPPISFDGLDEKTRAQIQPAFEALTNQVADLDRRAAEAERDRDGLKTREERLKRDEITRDVRAAARTFDAWIGKDPTAPKFFGTGASETMEQSNPNSREFKGRKAVFAAGLQMKQILKQNGYTNISDERVFEAVSGLVIGEHWEKSKRADLSKRLNGRAPKPAREGGERSPENILPVGRERSIQELNKIWGDMLSA